MLLLVALPLLAVAALLIRIESHGHPIYRQRRVGRDGAPFELYKLRTMVDRRRVDGPRARARRRRRRPHHAARRASCGAPRSTSCPTSSTCCAARCRSSARARPCRSRSIATRSASAAASRVHPGLTGWAQIQGRASLPWSERIELDLWYVEHESLRLDLRILWRTVRMVVAGDGLYKGETGGWRDPPR